ncbi:MAG: hypothetical protein R6U50_01405 [Desulfobacterales bacterium]
MDTEIIVVDQTIREGMQYRGLMFSAEERKKILAFQERLGIHVSQAAYPPAHHSEVEHASMLHRLARREGYGIRIAGLCRAKPEDVGRMLDHGFTDYHLHSGVNPSMIKRFGLDGIFTDLSETVSLIRAKVPEAFTILAFADVGSTDPDLLDRCVEFSVEKLCTDGITLPDTSGRLAPNVYYGMVRRIAERIQGRSTRIAVHCHNDFGMASANSVMGVVAGASIVEVAALGIGERNGIGDVYVVSRMLKEQGIPVRVKTDEVDLFRSYYAYINDICVRQTGFGPLHYNTPAFGDAIMTHVAGTHGIIHYSTADEKKYFLNVLCGRHLVEDYLKSIGIAYDRHNLDRIVKRIKDRSAVLNRSLDRREVCVIVEEIGREDQPDSV